MTNIGIDVVSLICLILTQIYMVLHTTDMIYERRCTIWELDVPLKEHHIEYSHTNAFIEKAYDWLKNSTYGYLTEKWGEVELDREALAEDFRKYMKGE